VKTVIASPPNCLILVQDSEGGDTPMPIQGRGFASNDSCVVVGTTADLDEETEISIGYCEKFAAEGMPNFEGRLKTPSKKITVETVYIEVLLEINVLSQETFLRIWTNHPTEPSIIKICVTSSE
jgi:hypothetical protein